MTADAAPPPHTRTSARPALRATTSTLLVAAMVAAVGLSASATIRLAEDSRVTPTIAPLSVALLEVLAVTGTLLWVLDRRRSVRHQAAAGVLLSSGVTLVAGAHSYGWFGAVAPIGLVVTVHLVSTAWRDPAPVATPAAPAASAARRTISTSPALRATDDFDALSRDKLREVARTVGVAVRGSRAELTARVRATQVAVDTDVSDDADTADEPIPAAGADLDR